VIAVHDKLTGTGRFTDGDLRLVEIFAGRAAVAVALSERVARDTVRRVVAAQEAERRRLALELHDETGQALTSILLGLKAIGGAKTKEEAESAEADVRTLVVQALQDVRALAVELRPSALDDFGLGPALERLAQTFAERSGVAASVEASLEERLPSEVETTLYRVVQEALSNIVKHAGATHVSVIVARRERSVVAIIEDDGVGFAPDGVREDALGLLGMRERLALVGGTLEIESADGTGTTVAAQVPVGTI
jgi:signal transduction histidine kinase